MAWMTTSTTVHALLVTKFEGKALSLVSLVPRRHGIEAWRVLKEEYEDKGGNRTAALLRVILNPRVRWEKMHREGRDVGDMLDSLKKDFAQYRVAAVRRNPACDPCSECDGTRVSSLP